MSESYALYHTLNKNIKQKDMSERNKSELIKKVSSLSTKEKEAIFLLIVEHARVDDNFIIDPSSVAIPFKGKQKNSKVEFDVEELPSKLMWIIWKFVTRE